MTTVTRAREQVWDTDDRAGRAYLTWADRVVAGCCGVNSQLERVFDVLYVRHAWRCCVTQLSTGGLRTGPRYRMEGGGSNPLCSTSQPTAMVILDYRELIRRLRSS